ncbi:MAG: hypothetical protein P8R54_33365 [Myxococcota bacterium]|nr:hypothetical protein [Myxococcota bacterium]
MAQFGDFLGRLFSTGDSRGLSGDVDLVLPPEPELAFYNEGLSRHRTNGDLVSDPDQLWAPTGRNRLGGLTAHLLSRRSEGVINFTDVLIIINRTDWERAVPGMTSAWPEKAAGILLRRFEAFCEEENLHLIFPQRPMQFHLIQDGGPQMEGEDIGLKDGEFVTGLLANQYGRPTTHSRALIAIHLNLPGTWEGYYEVGRLYNDQALFTLGNHWLDNFSHPALPRPALYRLQQQEDGSFVHIIDPEVAELFEITSQGPDTGPSVLTIQSINGTPVAHLVLEVISDTSTADPEALTRALPTSKDSADSASSHESPADGVSRREKITSVYDRPMNTSRSVSDVAATKTIIPDAVSERILTLRERGALLQKVHFSRFMLGYDVYIGRSGEVGTAIPDPIATIQVRRRQVNLLPHFGGLSLNGTILAPGTPTPLEGDNEINLGEQRILYNDLRGVSADGWPYVGEIRRGGSNIHLIFGKGHQLGRARNCQVTLPDKPHNENIIWRTEVGEGATIRVRSGEIPKAQFYTDSIMVASLHAEVDLSGEPMLENRARHCHTFVRRRKDVFSLYPTKDRNGPTNLDLQPGDQILIGNSVFEVDYPPAEGPRSPANTMDMRDILSPDILAAAIDCESEAKEDTDLPAAGGLGERGSPPPALALGISENDSIFDTGPAKPGIDLPVVTPADELPPERIAAPMIIDEGIDTPSEPETTPGSVDLPPPLPPAPEVKPLSALDAPSLSNVGAPPPLPDSTALPDSAALPGEEPPPSVSDGLATTTSFLDSVTDEADLFDMTLLGAEELPEPPALSEEDGKPTGVMPSLPVDSEPPLPAGSDPALPPPLPAEPPSLPAELPAEPPPLLPTEAEESGRALMPLADEEEITRPGIPEETPENVAVVEESQCQFELSRPARLTLVGWTAYGDTTIGNHHDATAVIPENRSEADQTFFPQDYFSLFVRGRRVKAQRVARGEARLLSGKSVVDETTEAEGMQMEIVRRDPDGEPDFFVTLTLQQDRRLPDPRAQLLAVAQDDPMVEALFTLGLPLRTPHTITLSGLTLTAQFDGERLTVTDYLDSYRKNDGSWRPFFVRHGEGRFQTAPEDGAPIVLSPGDLLLSGTVIRCFEVS